MTAGPIVWSHDTQRMHIGRGWLQRAEPGTGVRQDGREIGREETSALDGLRLKARWKEWLPLPGGLVEAGYWTYNHDMAREEGTLGLLQLQGRKVQVVAVPSPLCYHKVSI